MPPTKPEIIADYACVTGEGPCWHPMEQHLYWLDIPQGRIFRYDPATGHHEICHQDDEAIGGITVQADGALLLFMARGAVRRWRDGALETIIAGIPEERDSRFNDVIADPEGRVFCGTMPTEDQLGRLYRLDPDGTLTQLLDAVDISNGMGFSPDLRQFYYTETGQRTITRFDYDRSTGALSNRRIFANIPAGEGVPDGLAVDAAGHVWSARWNGSRLVRYTPDGDEERRITFPAKQVSSVTFGGPDLTDIYVTTAGGDNKAKNGPGAGALFHLNLGIPGRPAFFSRVKIELD